MKLSFLIAVAEKQFDEFIKELFIEKIAEDVYVKVYKFEETGVYFYKTQSGITLSVDSSSESRMFDLYCVTVDNEDVEIGASVFRYFKKFILGDGSRGKIAWGPWTLDDLKVAERIDLKSLPHCLAGDPVEEISKAKYSPTAKDCTDDKPALRADIYPTATKVRL